MQINTRVNIIGEHQPEIYTVREINKKGTKVKLNWFGEPFVDKYYCNKQGWFDISILKEEGGVEEVMEEDTPEEEPELLDKDKKSIDEWLQEYNKEKKNNLSQAEQKVRNNLYHLISPVNTQELDMEVIFRINLLKEAIAVSLDNVRPFLAIRLPFLYYPAVSLSYKVEMFFRNLATGLENKLKHGIWLDLYNTGSLDCYLRDTNLKALSVFIENVKSYPPELEDTEQPLEEWKEILNTMKQSFVYFEGFLLEHYVVATKQEDGYEIPLTADNLGINIEQIYEMMDLNEQAEYYKMYEEYVQEGFNYYSKYFKHLWN